MQPQAQHPGIFLTIEGVEGVGKSTAVKFIQKYLAERAQDFIVTREPGGTGIAEQIRQILLTPNPEEVLAPEAELLLMFAARAQHVVNKIEPALQAGMWVISDRFADASYAYQGMGRGLNLSQIAALEKWVVKTYPKATILLDAPPSIGLTRAKNRGPQDRIEQEKLDFFERVREGYLQRAANDSKRFFVIDATQPLVEVHAEIKTLLDKLLLEKTC
ncbi:MAG: dTMP kinase [Gammaproteobacteria bacterium]|nr:dTMP kinase [Gammaproteobacteria bacterium]